MRAKQTLVNSTEPTEQEIAVIIDKISTISAAMWMTVIGTLGILFLPLLVSGIIDELGFSAQQAGYVAAAEMAGVAIASGMGVFWVRRVNWRTISTLSIIVFIVANGVSLSINDYLPMLVARLFVGLASGALLAIGLACQSDSKKADRIFGYWVACQMTVSSAGYLMLPGIRATWGIDGFLWALIILGATTFVSVLFLPKQGLDRTSSAEQGQRSLVTGIAALIGALLFFAAQGGLWAFLERLGLAANLSTVEIGVAFAISSYLGIVGGLAKNWLADAAGPTSPFIFVVIGELLMLLILSVSSSHTMFTIAVCLLQFCWAMGMASFLGALNIIDKSGRLVLLLIAIAKIGYSVGPAIMGWLYRDDDFTYVLAASGIFIVVGILTATVLNHSRTEVAAAAS